MRPSEFCRAIKGCRSCGESSFTSIIDFGEPYISEFVEQGQTGVRAPLHVIRCDACGLVQLEHTVHRDWLFREDYHYRSGTNETMVSALADVVRYVGEHVALNAGDAVLDIGSNDGTLLQHYPPELRRFGVEPAINLPQPADYEIVVFRRFWPLEHAAPQLDLLHGCKAITSIATFYATDDPHGYVEAIHDHLADDGIWVVQMQGESEVLRSRAIDYFCHEHLCLWGLESFTRLVGRHELQVPEVEFSPINGGSVRFLVKHAGPGPLPWSQLEPVGLTEWQAFAEQADNLRQESVLYLQHLRDERVSVLGAAASTKANTLLQWYGITPDLLPAIIERAPEKVGRFTVGTRIPIISEEEGIMRKPTVLVALAWHFAEAFRARYPDCSIVTLLPTLRIYPPLGASLPVLV